jgi:hypothetical protein
LDINNNLDSVIEILKKELFWYLFRYENKNLSSRGFLFTKKLILLYLFFRTII